MLYVDVYEDGYRVNSYSIEAFFQYSGAFAMTRAEYFGFNHMCRFDLRRRLARGEAVAGTRHYVLRAADLF